MQPHHKVTLSHLWNLTKQFFYFVQCKSKHSDDQRIVKDNNTLFVVEEIHRVSIMETFDEHGYVYADDGK